MSYILNTEADRQAMLAAIGVGSVDELFAQVPEDLRFRGELNLPPAMDEMELAAYMAELAGRNVAAGQKVCFLGGGSYDHFIPAVVDYVAGRGEFYTSYTPYQPEASQGNLQVFFEYQTLITQLTGMDVSNASLYDGGSAAAEAVLMCLVATGRRGSVVVPESLHPEYRQTIATYLSNLDVRLHTVPTPHGIASPELLARSIGDDTACVVIQQPNFFGCVERLQSLVAAAHERGALVVAAVDPISLGILKRPGDLGVDIVVAEGQSLGTPMQFGGPNQGLFALRATVYLAALGPQGLRETAEACLRKAHYARTRLAHTGRFAPAFGAPIFKEFVLRDTDDAVHSILAEALDKGFFAGVPLGQWYPELSDCLLVAVTEKRSRREIDALADCVSQPNRQQEMVDA
jgi:glycine dehydrogenase subunit 1